jgi:hypothetical protein
MKALMGERAGLAAHLKDDLYQQPALIPASPWLGSKAPAKPGVRAEADNGGVRVSWWPQSTAKVANWALWIRHGDTWSFHTFPVDTTSQLLKDDPRSGPITEIVVSAVDRLGNESARATVGRPKALKYPWPGLTTRPSVD